MEKANGTSSLPVVPLADRIKERGAKLEVTNQSAAQHLRGFSDTRRQPRFEMVADIRINSRTRGVLKGRCVDISESGIAAMLTMEVPLGELVELNFAVPSGPVTIHATVRQKNAFRYGFEFVGLDSVLEVIRRACRDLAVDQSLLSPSIY